MFCYSRPSKSTYILPQGDNFLLPKSIFSYYVENGLFEQSLIDWSKQFVNKNTVFLDIGAHSGTYSINLAPHCKNVYSFEPQRMTYYALCGSVAISNYPNIFCHNVALGETEREQTLYINSEDGGSSSLIPHNNTFSTEKVQVKTLDSFDLRDISFIKIDVEGFEANVIRGAVNTLKNSNYPHILFEANPSQREQEIDTVNVLNSLGYQVIPVGGYPNMRLATKV